MVSYLNLFIWVLRDIIIETDFFCIRLDYSQYKIVYAIGFFVFNVVGHYYCRVKCVMVMIYLKTFIFYFFCKILYTLIFIIIIWFALCGRALYLVFVHIFFNTLLYNNVIIVHLYLYEHYILTILVLQ